MRKSVQVLLAAGGFALLVWMVRKVGFAVILQHLAEFGLGPILFLIAVYALAQICFCAAWHQVIEAPYKPGFWRTFQAYLAGDALNMTIPSGNLAGEPVKVMLVRDFIPLESAITSVTVYKFADFVSMTIFLLAGWFVQFAFYSLPLAWNLGAGIIGGGMFLASLFLFYLQKRGFYHPTGKWLQKVEPLKRWIESKLESAHLVDAGIRDFYASRGNDFALSVFYNFLAWSGGVLEIVLFQAIAGVPVSFPAALTIETFSLFINNVVFFVPARIGVIEGGRVLLFLTLGYPAQVGLSYGILRRIRELVWIGAGLVILLLYKRSHPRANPAASL